MLREQTKSHYSISSLHHTIKLLSYSKTLAQIFNVHRLYNHCFIALYCDFKIGIISKSGKQTDCMFFANNIFTLFGKILINFSQVIEQNKFNHILPNIQQTSYRLCTISCCHEVHQPCLQIIPLRCRHPLAGLRGGLFI